jgi:hypothetical protein
MPFLADRFQKAKIDDIDYEGFTEAVAALVIVSWMLDTSNDRVQALPEVYWGED